MNCYFCNANLTPSNRFGATMYECDKCMQENDLYLVLTGIAYDRTIKNAFIFTKNNAYNVRLDFKKNCTHINFLDASGNSNQLSKEIAKVNGFPINPSNIKEKIKLYMIFS